MQTTHPHSAPRRRRTLTTATAAAGVAILAGCGGSGGGTDSPPAAKAAPDPNGLLTAPRSARAAQAVYDPKIVPADFTDTITNPYFKLLPGDVRITKGTKDGVPQTHTTRVTARTKTILGVRCRVVSDIVTTNGALAEKVSDWYAQDAKGNVWYFGEATADYEHGVVTSTKGSWLGGVDGAKPGIVMPAHPKPGPSFYSEFRPGVAEDKGQVLSDSETLKIAYGSFKNVVLIRDTNPLDPQLISHKWYTKGVGLLQTTRVGSSHKEHASLVTLKAK
jgi:predicted small lipoprotein YifL